jgi:hypothetical protein
MALAAVFLSDDWRNVGATSPDPVRLDRSAARLPIRRWFPTAQRPLPLESVPPSLPAAAGRNDESPAAPRPARCWAATPRVSPVFPCLLSVVCRPTPSRAPWPATGSARSPFSSVARPPPLTLGPRRGHLGRRAPFPNQAGRPFRQTAGYRQRPAAGNFNGRKTRSKNPLDGENASAKLMRRQLDPDAPARLGFFL